MAERGEIRLGGTRGAVLLGRPRGCATPCKALGLLGQWEVAPGAGWGAGVGGSLLGGGWGPCMVSLGSTECISITALQHRVACLHPLHRGPSRAGTGGGSGGSVGQAGSCLRKQVCRGGLSRKCGASAMLIVITFNLLLKITQSQVKEDYRAPRSLITGRRLRRRDSPQGYQPFPPPGPLDAVVAPGAACTCGFVCMWGSQVGSHMCEGEDVLTCMLGHRLRPVHVDRCAFGRTRLRGSVYTW